MSNYFNLYLGIIFGKNILLLGHKNNNLYFFTVNFQENLHPTVKNISLNNYLSFTLFGKNGIFPEIQINKNISPGSYKFCGAYEKDGKFLGYIRCKNITIVK